MQPGTSGLQAPDQVRVKAVDQGADVYGFGAVLIELFGEKPVWERLNPYLTIVINGEIPDYGHLPHSIQSICSDCLRPKGNRSQMTSVLEVHLQIEC